MRLAGNPAPTPPELRPFYIFAGSYSKYLLGCGHFNQLFTYLRVLFNTRVKWCEGQLAEVLVRCWLQYTYTYKDTVTEYSAPFTTALVLLCLHTAVLESFEILKCHHIRVKAHTRRGSTSLGQVSKWTSSSAIYSFDILIHYRIN